jgi:NCAIR mutase (PurE)-related protein
VSPQKIRALLEDVRDGKLELDDALRDLKSLPFEDLGFARIDHHRALRTGAPEVIFGEGKTPEQIVAIAESLHATHQNVLITRINPEAAQAVQSAIPEAEYLPTPRIVRVQNYTPSPTPIGTILVMAAGTTDLPVAEEAIATLEVLGHPVERLYDVGVAGLHRLLASHQTIASANVLIVVAGMEGALPSVVAGLVERPVIAVPTSVGYGAALNGLTALFGMLTSCAAGISVVNIDNGFGAAMAAAQINSPRNNGNAER